MNPREHEMSLPLLPATVIGSHSLPSWLWLAREAMAQGRLGATEVREVLEDATRLAIADQVEAGVDVLGTGEMPRVRFIVSFYDHLTGIRRHDPPRKVGAPHYDSYPVLEAVERVAAPEGLGIVEEWKLARRLTDRPLKATCPGPYTLMIPLRPGGPYRDREALLADLIIVVNRELRALVEAGADFIQIDEPNFVIRGGEAKRLTEIFNAAVEGVRAKIALHVCFGNLHGRPFAATRGYRWLFPALLEARCDQFVFEYANREMAELGLFREYPPNREVGVGVVDVKTYQVESAEEVARRIRLALDCLPAERLWITPDCGFWETPRHVAVGKLKAMVEGVRIVRGELARQGQAGGGAR
jgi:5-methyltetrahydropteroyltriglutamate--homocysteine methyltransferase